MRRAGVLLTWTPQHSHELRGLSGHVAQPIASQRPHARWMGSKAPVLAARAAIRNGSVLGVRIPCIAIDAFEKVQTGHEKNCRPSSMFTSATSTAACIAVRVTRYPMSESPFG